MKKLLVLGVVCGLVFPTCYGAKVKRRRAVEGLYKMEIVTCPAEVAEDFERLNKQVILYYPTNRTAEKYPLVINLHGSGGANRTIESLSRNGPGAAYINLGAKVLVPQSGRVWNPKSLGKLLDYILSVNPDIDTKRIYCVGYSMGGKGTWEWAMHEPNRFAAIIPMAFIPDLSNIKNMVHLPIWTFVGTKDKKERAEGIPKMAEELKKLGSSVIKATVYEGANHGNTRKRFREEKGVYEWLFNQKRK